LTMTVTADGSTTRSRPRKNFAAPTPPARTVTVRRAGTRVALLARAALGIEGGALDCPASDPRDEPPDLLDRRVLAGIRARLARDALLHQGAAEIVHPREERELGELVVELHPRGLEIVDHAAQHETRERVDAEIVDAFRRRLADDAVAEELGV